MSASERRVSVAMRWPAGVGGEYVAVPVALLRHADRLGLYDGHVRLLLAMESFRYDDSEQEVFPSQATLAALCGCSVSQIERRIRELRTSGLIEVERRVRPGGKRVNHYTRHGLNAALARVAVDAGDPAWTRGTPDGHPAPARASNPPWARGSYPASARSEEEEREPEEGKHAPRALSLTREVLADFNERAGTNYSSNDSFGRLVARRIAENPDLTADDYRRILATAFRRPWWKGVPSPRVVFTAAQFEHARQALTARPSAKDQRVEAFMKVLRDRGLAQPDVVDSTAEEIAV